MARRRLAQSARGRSRLTGFNNGVLSLAANESCWQGRPFADAIEIRVHRAIRDQWLDLSVGRADVVEVPAEQLRQAQQQQLTVVVSPPVKLLALQVANTARWRIRNCARRLRWRSIAARCST